MPDHLLTEETCFPSDNHPTNIRGSHSLDAYFAESAIIMEIASFEDVVAGTATKIVTKMASGEKLQQDRSQITR